MAKEYLDKLSKLMIKAFTTKLNKGELVVKHFFSGAAVYANGKICITLTPIGLAIKLPESDLNNYVVRMYGCEDQNIYIL